MPSPDNFNYSLWARNNYHGVCGLIAESALYGMYTALLIYAVRQLNAFSEDNPKPRVIPLLSLLLMFALSTTLWALDITDFIGGLDEILLKTYSTTTQQYSNYMIEINPRVIVKTTIFSIEYLIGDSMVVWRACALWGYSKKIMLLLILLLSSAAVLVFFFVGCLGFHNWEYILGEPEVCLNSYRGTFFLSVTINLLATSLIATKAWLHHRFLRSVSVKKSNSVLKIMILLVESGFIYFIIWATKSVSILININHNAGTPGGQFAVSLLNPMGNQVVGLYPTLLVVIVNAQCSAIDADSENHDIWGTSAITRRTKSSHTTEEGQRAAYPSISDSTTKL
ncbi:hypothetical protein EV361DRAFT_394845 [Lentinula raphanica]|uniref:Uncharacterized protein n=1 Tax=Lentinula raphanica TaxID=153919 RepID=A0AA38PLX1_9AGAR|nr:hypothetical protein F5878DRAFT_3254 [Lentinula raphanica]KAJ3977920.1 hypothetical protein EV361DRAFT_394845 [Lentinula raphanica]